MNTIHFGLKKVLIKVLSALMIATLLLSAIPVTPAYAAAAELSAWTNIYTGGPGNDNGTINAGTLTVPPGASRIFVVAVCAELDATTTMTTLSASLGGTALTQIGSTIGNSAREHCYMGYFRESQIPAGASALTVPYNVSGSFDQVDGIHVRWATYSGIDQTNPIYDWNAASTGTNAITFGATIDYLQDGLTFYVAGNGGSPATMPAPTGFTQRLATTTNGHSSFTASITTAPHTANGTYAANTGFTFGGITSTRSALVVASLRPAVPTPPTITSAVATTFAVGQAGTFTVTAIGFPAPTTFSVGGDTLPTGVTFNTTTHVLGGTPAAGTTGVYNLIFTVSNGVLPNATQNFTLTVGQAPAFTSANNTTFLVGTAGTFTVTATGFPTPTLSLATALPTGITFNAATGVLSGTPAAGTGGAYTLNFTAANGINPNATQTFTLTINQAPAITSAATTTFNVGTNGTFTVNRTGFPLPATVTMTGTLPGGVTYVPGTRILSGIPATGTVGNWPLVFTASNGVTPDAVQSFTLTVAKGGQTISFTQPTTPVGFGSTFPVNPTASSGLPVTVVVTSGPCTITPFPGPYTVTTTGLGTCRLTATQAGDASYNAAPSIFRDVVVQPAATTTTITSSVNPSVLGQNVIFTVRVTTASGAIPTGTVTIQSCELYLIFCVNNQVWGTYSLDNGVASVNKDDLPVARGGGYIVPNRITVTYSPAPGAPYNNSSTTLEQTVNTANTAVALVSSINPSSFNQSVVFTATVTVQAPGVGVVSGGTVTLYEGATVLGTGTVNASGVVTFPAISNLAMGSHDITAHFVGTDDFGTSTSPVLTQIVRRPSTTTLTTSAPISSVYGSAVTFTATVTGAASTPTGTVSFYDDVPAPDTLLGTANLNSGVATFNYDALVVGEHNITAVYSGNTFYVSSTSSIVVQTVIKATLTVTAEPKTITYGDADPIFTFQYDGFLLGDDAADILLPPTCDAPTPHVNVARDVGNNVIPYTDIIDCSGASDENYQFAYDDGDLTVNPKALTITADNQGKTYGFTLTFDGDEFTAAGLIFSDAVTSVSLYSEGAIASATNGTYDIIPSAALGTGLGNYAITYVNGTLTVGGNFLIITANDYVDENAKPYGTSLTLPGTAFTYYLAGGGVLQPGESLDSVTLTSFGTPANAPVGTYDITPSNAVGTGLSNYVIIYNNGQLDVNPIPLSFAVHSKTKVYGDTFTAFTGAFTGLMPFDVAVVTPVYDSPGALATATVTPPGPAYPINVSFNDPNNRLNNYTFAPIPAATLTVLHRTLTVTPTDRSKVYGDTLTSVDFTGTITDIQNLDNITATYDSPLGDPATATVGTYDISATLSDPDGMLPNYTLVNNVGTLTVAQRDLEVTSNSQSKIYGDAFNVADFTGSVVGLQNDDVITPTYNSAGAPATAPVGIYDITVLPLIDNGNVLSNYHVIYDIGTLAVQRRDLTVTPNDRSKLYGDTIIFTSTDGVVDGLQAGDVITPVYSSPGAIATATVAGSPYPITVTLDDPGNKLSNYNYTLDTGTLTVNQRPLVVTPDNQTKVYGTWFLNFTGIIDGIQNNENITANYTSAGSPPSAAVGSYNIVPTLNDPTGKLGNYAVTLNNGTLTVTQATLTITANNQSVSYGSPDPALTFIYSGFLGTDTAIDVDSPPTCSIVEDPHAAVGTYTIRCSNGADANYSFAYVDGTLTVTRRTLTVTPADKIKLYGVNFTAFTGTITGIQYGEVITVTYDSLGAPAIAPVGDYDINAALTAAPGVLDNYTVVSNIGTLTVNPRTLVISPDSKTKLYGDTFSDYTATVNGIQNGDPITLTYASDGAVATAGVGPYPITVTPGPANLLTNYDITINPATLTVNHRPLVVTPDNKVKVFGTLFTDFTGTVNGIQNSDPITVTYDSLGAPESAPVGAYDIVATITATPAVLANYAVTNNLGTLTVGNTLLTVTADNQSKIYGDLDPIFTFVYSGFQGSDGPTDLTVQPSCQVLPAHNAVGTYDITCSGGVDENYTFLYVPATLTITSRALTVDVDNKTKTYGDTFTAFTGTLTGVQGGDNITVSYSSPGAIGTATVAGSPYAITATLNDPLSRLGNYTVSVDTTATLTVTPRTLTVTSDNKTKVYGASFSAFTGSLIGVQAGDGITVTYASAGSTVTAPVGSYPITITLNDPNSRLAGNYTVVPTEGTLTVTQRDLVVAPADKTKVYGDTFTAFTGTITGIQNGDQITATYTSLGAVDTATVAGSPYLITATLNAPAGVLDSYNVILNTGELAVTRRALVVTPDNKAKVFGTTFTAFTGVVTGLQPFDPITVTYDSPGAIDTAPVDSYPITATLTDLTGRLPNYAVTLNTGTLTVGNTVLTVTADPQTKVYGNLDPIFTFVYSGFQGSDGPTDLTVQPSCQVLPAHNAVGTYSITCSGGVDENYVFNYVGAILTVTPRTLTVDVDNKTKTYGDTFTAFTGTLTGAQGGDNITVSYSSPGAIATATVAGSPYAITATLNDPLSRLANYTVSVDTTATLTVTPRTLTVTSDNKNKVYGASFSAFTGSLIGVQAGDGITVTYASAGSAVTAPVGPYPITITLNDPNGRLAGNYTVVPTEGTLTVTQRDLVVTPADKTKVYGDIFTAFTGTITGIQNGDPITATYTSPGAVDTATVAGSPYLITATLNAPAGVLDSYNVILNTGELAVTRRALVVTPDNKAKVFGTTFTAFTGTISGIQAGDNITATYASLGAIDTAPVGPYAITVTLNDPGNRLPNYTVTLNEGTLTVSLSVLEITPDDQTITYGDPDPSPFTFTYSGFLGSDTPAVLTTQPTCRVLPAHNAVGTYDISCAGGVDENYSFSYATATLTVTPRALTVTPGNKSKVYGNTFTAFTGVVTGIQAGDDITVTYDSAGAPADAVVGPYPIIATLNDPNDRLDNYTVTLNTGTLTVTQRALVVTPTNASKVYGNVFTAFGGVIVGIQNGDPITATYASPGAVATATVGAHTITAALNAPAGVLDNYSVTSNTGTLTVTQRDLTVSPADKTKVYGTVFTAFTGTITGIQNADAITATYSSPGAPAAALVGPYEIAAELNDPDGRLPNYNVILNTGTLTVEQAVPITAVISDNNPAGVAELVTFTATVTSSAGTPTGSVTFFDGASVMSTLPLVNGVAAFSTSTLTVGQHTITVVYSGDANFSGSTSAPYIQGVGQTPTTTVVTSSNNPSVPGQLVTFTAIVSSTTGVPTGTVTFSDGATILGTGTLTGGVTTFTTDALAAGAHNITASYGGDMDFFVSVSTVLVQVVVPDTVITSTPPDPDNDTTPTFAFNSVGPFAKFECRVDGGTFSACTSGDAFGPLTAGNHKFEVRAVDIFNNADPTPASYSWTIDISAPDTTIGSNPPAITNSVDAIFTFSSAATDLAGFECQMDGGGFAACTTPRNYTGLSAGSHTFEVRAFDNVGNVDPSPASHTWLIDFAYPTVTVNQAVGQADPTSIPSINFTVVFSETVTGFTSADVSLAGSTAGGTLVATVSGAGPTYTINVTGMTASGTIVISIPADAAVDSAGNNSLSSASTDNTVSYTIDTVPPVVVSSLRADPDPASVVHIHFTVTFSEPVTGVDMNDFSLTTTGVWGSAVTAVSGSGSVYTVTVNVGSKNGVIRLDVLDDNTIRDSFLNPLSAAFSSGEMYTIISKSPIFADVPYSYWANSNIERLYNAGITGGCGASPLIYCPDDRVTRAQMAVFLMKTMHGASYTPPPATGTVFGDVPASHWAAAWIEAFYADGITEGCGVGIYCPEEVMTTRAQMAVFLLKARHGRDYRPLAPSGTVFNDVPVDHWAAAWIEQLAVEGITTGCGNGNYCPEDSLSRAEMAVFLVRTLYLPKLEADLGEP